MDPRPNQHQLSCSLLSQTQAYDIRFFFLCQEKNGDPYRIRTDVKGVRGLCLNHLTNGPFGTPSGTRTLDTLIKSQVLYQLS